MQRRQLLRSLIALPLLGCATPQVSVGPTPGPQPGLFIDVGYKYGPISPLVYGSNTGPWQTIGLEHRTLSHDAGISMIRWPGGNWGDEHDVTELMIDEYMAMCQTIGATPSIHVRVFQGTAQKAADMVKYVNITKKYAVKYWAIGNEPDLFVKKRGAAKYGVDEYVADFVAFRAAMKAVDPSIIVMGPEQSQFSPNENYPRDATGAYWLRRFLQQVPDVEMVSLHRYPFGEGAVTPKQLAADPASWSASIDYVRGLMREVLGKEVPLAITEANSDWSGRVDELTGTNSFRNALWWTDVLGRLIAKQCTVVNQFCMGAISGQGLGIFGPVSYSSGPLPVYQTYTLFHKFGSMLVHASSADADFHLVAAQRSDGVLTAVLVNHRESSVTLPLTIANASITKAQAWRFGEGYKLRDDGLVDITKPIEWPALSATLLELQ